MRGAFDAVDNGVGHFVKNLRVSWVEVTVSSHPWHRRTAGLI